ncbi:GNAT family N-acetyltransferase [Streptomyces sp. NPDC000878]
MTHESTAQPAIPAQLRLTGEGLVLREWTEADPPAMADLFDDPEIAHWTPLASPFDPAEARAAVTRATGYHLTDEPPILTVDKGRSLALRTRAHDRP